MANNKHVRYFETGIYIVILLISLLIPFFSFNQTGTRNWDFIFRLWLDIIPVLFVFLVNNFILAPKLLLKGKYWPYIISCLLLVTITTACDNTIFHKKSFIPHPQRMVEQLHTDNNSQNHEPTMNCGQNSQSPQDIQNKSGKFSYPMPFNPKPPFIRYGTSILFLLVIGFNSGIKIFIRWNEEENRRTEKEKEHLITELAFLKHQISPHFFMNTLNNIHALVDIDGERAKEAIIKLSKLMRYLLYESDIEKTTLDKEIEFMESYIELMKLRYNDNNLSISIEYPANSKEISVPSFLFLSFIENAFKHGINIRKKSFIEIKFIRQNEQLTFTIRNYNYMKSTGVPKENSGIGLENVTKRLKLLYKDNYSLSATVVDDIYEVSLSIPIV